VDQDGQLACDSEHSDDPPPTSAWVEPASSARSEPSVDWHGNELEHTTPTSVLGSHLSNTLGHVAQVDSAPEQQTFAAALFESRSPVLSTTPSDDRRDTIGGEWARLDVVGERIPTVMLSADGTRDANRDSSRSSTSTVTGFMEPPTIVRNVSVARRTGAYVTKLGAGRERERSQDNRAPNGAYAASLSRPSNEIKHPPSPLSSTFGSEEGSASGSGSSGSISQDHPTPTTEDGTDSPLLYYTDPSPSPDPSKRAFSPSAHHHLLVSATDTFGGVRKDDEDVDMYEEEDNEENDEHEEEFGNPAAGASIVRPKIVISGAPGSGGTPTPLYSGITASPLSPLQRYRGWLSEVVAPLEEFIDETVDPRNYYLDLQEIAEGESGLVYAARLTDINLHKLKLPPLIKARDSDDLANGRTTLVAIKSVAIMPSGSPKLVDLKRELTLMKGLWHDNVLSMDAVYVDLVEDALWIRMELMERSLADLIGLIGSGLMLQERMMARFANDVRSSTCTSQISLLIFYHRYYKRCNT
jgi:hypothetical protein